MSLAASIREQVRQRAQCACEFCGITEIDTGGMLTIDHFQPRTKAGSDSNSKFNAIQAFQPLFWRLFSIDVCCFLEFTNQNLRGVPKTQQ
jgi:hypothetical protein